MAAGQHNNRHWYLVQSRPRQEQTARTHLERQGYPVYLPMTRQRKIHRQRLTSTVTPLFPRYLFICLDERADNWSPIRSTRGVSTIVRFGHQPARVPDDLVPLLQQRENADGLHEAGTDFRSGDRVRIDDGPMWGYEGIFIAASGEDRVLVLLDIMGKAVQLKLESHQIARAG